MTHPLDESGSWPAVTYSYYTGPERRGEPRPGSPRLTGWRVFLRRLWSLIAYSDTTPVRASLAIAAATWAALLLMPGDTLGTRPIYRALADLTGAYPDLKWGVAWLLLTCGLVWRLFAERRRSGWALAINVASAVMFSATPIAVLSQQPAPAPAGLAPHIALALASYWVAVRTNINTVHGWRGD